MALRAKKRWPEAYVAIVERIRSIAAEFGVPVKDALYQLALARGDNDTIGMVRSNRTSATARRCWPRYGALYHACLLLALDLELLDGVTPQWRNWNPEPGWPITGDLPPDPPGVRTLELADPAGLRAWLVKQPGARERKPMGEDAEDLKARWTSMTPRQRGDAIVQVMKMHCNDPARRRFIAWANAPGSPPVRFSGEGPGST